jgi:hypothetical protein
VRERCWATFHCPRLFMFCMYRCWTTFQLLRPFMSRAYTVQYNLSNTSSKSNRHFVWSAVHPLTGTIYTYKMVIIPFHQHSNICIVVNRFHPVTKLLGLPGPIKPDLQSVQSKLVHWGQNDMVLNWYRRELPHWNLRISTARSPPFPSECSTFPYLPRPVHQQT